MRTVFGKGLLAPDGPHSGPYGDSRGRACALAEQLNDRPATVDDRDGAALRVADLEFVGNAERVIDGGGQGLGAHGMVEGGGAASLSEPP